MAELKLENLSIEDQQELIYQAKKMIEDETLSKDAAYILENARKRSLEVVTAMVLADIMSYYGVEEYKSVSFHNNTSIKNALKNFINTLYKVTTKSNNTASRIIVYNDDNIALYNLIADNVYACVDACLHKKHSLNKSQKGE